MSSFSGYDASRIQIRVVCGKEGIASWNALYTAQLKACILVLPHMVPRVIVLL